MRRVCGAGLLELAALRPARKRRRTAQGGDAHARFARHGGGGRDARSRGRSAGGRPRGIFRVHHRCAAGVREHHRRARGGDGASERSRDRRNRSADERRDERSDRAAVRREPAFLRRGGADRHLRFARTRPRLRRVALRPRQRLSELSDDARGVFRILPRARRSRDRAAAQL